jgi:twinkle protein
MKTFEDYGISIPPGSSGEVRALCPECSPSRKKSQDKCMAVNTVEGTWHCHHCGWSGGLKNKRDWVAPEQNRKIFRRPEFREQKSLPPMVIEWFKDRGISQVTLEKTNVGFENRWIQIPYYRDGQVVNIKHRHIDEKQFRQEKDAEKVFFNMDRAAATGEDNLVITEGELDALACMSAGIDNVVSVPDGAPAPGTKSYITKFEYLANCEGFLGRFKNIIIAVDNDEPGKTLEAELVRRLGAERCKHVTWPEGCKDANDLLVKSGAEALRGYMAQAVEYPLSGIITAKDVIEDLFDIFYKGPKPSYSTGWKSLDSHYRVRPGELTIITGIPSHGKSEFMDALAINRAQGDGWVFGMFSPENWPVAQHVQKLAEKYIGKPFAKGVRGQMDRFEADDAANYIHEHFFWIAPEDESPTVDFILEKARQLVFRYGITGLTIDPWNEIDHVRPEKMAETEYISQSLSKLRRFARMNSVHVWLVAHPTKLQKDMKTNTYPVPMPYDIAGSAHFRNKADNCLTIHRENFKIDQVTVHIQKVRFKEIGRNGGEVTLKWSRASGKFSE